MKISSRLLFLYLFLFLIIIFIQQTLTKPTFNPEFDKESNEFPKQKSLYYSISKTIQEIEWLLNQLIDVLSEMVSGLESDPTLLSNYHFRQILAHMIKRIDYILEHFETVKDLPPEITNDLQRLDCVRIRLSNYINKNSDEKIDDSICKSGGKATTMKSVTSVVSNDQIVVIITQILQIIVQIVNQMGSLGKPDQNWSSAAHKITTANWDDMMSEIKNLIKSTTAKPKSKTSTKYPIKASTFNWDNLISEIIGQSSSTKKSGTKKPGKTTTISWEDLISEMISQMSSTSVSSGSASTSAPVETTSVDWDDLISEVVGEMDNQSGTKSIPQTQTTSDPMTSNAEWDELISAMVWDQNQNKMTQTTQKSDPPSNENWDQLVSEIMDQNQYTRTSPSRSMIKTTSSVESTTYDFQACIDSIISIIGGVESQMPGMSKIDPITITTTSKPQQTTQNLDAMISGILGQFG